MDIKIRIGDESDIPHILDIINYEIEGSPAIYDYAARTLEEQLRWYHNKAANGYPLIVSIEDGIVTGFGTYGPFREKEGYKKTVEHSIYTHKSFRNKGIGKVLLNELIYMARNQGIHTMIAGIDSGNTGSIKFHKQFGFEEVGRFKEVGYKFDRWLDVVFMQLMLEGPGT